MDLPQKITNSKKYRELKKIAEKIDIRNRYQPNTLIKKNLKIPLKNS